jgi:hypothetical protein
MKEEQSNLLTEALAVEFLIILLCHNPNGEAGGAGFCWLFAQAAAYINEKRISVPKYLDALKKVDLNLIDYDSLS